jgi:hypothetical protein
MGLLKSWTGFELPALLQAGPAWSMKVGYSRVAELFSHGVINLPAIVVALARDLAADDRHQGERASQRRAGGDQDDSR